MPNKNSLVLSREVAKELMFALIEISCVAEMAHKHACSESEDAGYVIPHSLAFIQRNADLAVQEASRLLMKRYNGNRSGG